MKKWIIAFVALCILDLVSVYRSKEPHDLDEKYKTIETSLEDAYAELSNDNEALIYHEIEYNRCEDTLSSFPWYRKIKTIHESAQHLTTTINNIKSILKKGEGYETILSKPMINADPASKLKRQIDSTAQLMKSSLDETDRNRGLISKNLEDVMKLGANWETKHFSNISPSMAQAELSSLKCDLANSERNVIRELFFYCVDQHKIHLNKFDIHAFPKTAEVLYPGERYEASIMLVKEGPMDDSPPLSSEIEISEIWVDGKPLEVKYNVGHYVTKATSVGKKTFTATIKCVDHVGVIREYSVTHSYTVVKPSAVVATGNERVLYAGIQNPVSVSAPFVLPENLIVTVNRGTLTGSEGHYVFTTNEPGSVTITVAKKTDDNTPYVIDHVAYTVKRKS